MLGGWLGANLPLTDSGYLDLAHGRSIEATGRLELPPVALEAELEPARADWLGSRLFYEVFRIGDDVGVRLLAALLVASGLLLLYMTCPGSAGWLIVLAALSAAAARMELSTSLFSWPLLAGSLFALTAFRRRSVWWALAFPVLLTLWSLLNHEAVIGVALLLLAAAEHLLRWIGALWRGDKDVKGLPALLLSGSLLVCLVLPTLLGSDPALHAERLLSAARLMSRGAVVQWTPVSLGAMSGFFVFASAAALLVGILPWSRAIPEALTLAGLALLSTTSAHFTIAFCGVASPPASRSLAGYLERWSPRGSRWRRGSTHPLSIISVGLLISAPQLLRPAGRHPFGRAVQVIAERHLAGPVFNVPQAGGLLGWSLGPERMAFADLRPASLAAFETEAATGEIARAMKAEPTHLALLSWRFSRAQLAPGELAGAGFRLLYADDEALLFARPVSNPEVVGRLGFEVFDPLMEPEDYPPDIVPSAIQEIFEYFKRYPMSGMLLLRLAPLLERVGRREEALEMLEAARRLRPRDQRLWKDLSRLYLYKGMYHLAEEASRRGLELGRDRELTAAMANALYGQGRFREAVGWFETVLEREPENLGALRSLVDIYERLDEPVLAFHYRKRLEALEEALSQELVAEAENKRRNLDFAGAAAAYRQAHQIAAADTDILWRLVVVLLAEHRNEEAVESLREIVRLRPDHRLGHLTLGALCARKVTCEPGEAWSHLETFLRLAPEDPNAALARQQLAALSRSKNR